MRKYVLLAALLLTTPAAAQQATIIRPAVQGPTSASSGHIATYNGTTGQIIQDGGAVPTSATTANVAAAIGVTGAIKSNGSTTFGQAACGDLSDSTGGCNTAIGTSGGTIPLLNGTNTWSAVQSILAELKIQDGVTGLLAGADSGATTLTDSTTKIFRMSLPHYVNADTPVALFAGSSAVSTNVLTLGGGNASQNAITTGAGYAAANNTTVTGTEIFSWTINGLTDFKDLYFSGTAPSVSGTGTPTIATGSTDSSGEVTSGTSATSVIITFASSKTNAPFCVVTGQGEALTYSISTTAITITQAALTGDKIDYYCTQH